MLTERTEYSQVFAEPTGELTYEAGVVPERVRQPDGSWKDVDLTLAPASDGSLRPKASVADVRFSSDGNGPLVTLVRGGRTMTLSLPSGNLRRPAVDGSSAKYPEVFSGVDLVVRATWTGFAHVLVVKTPQAAASAAVREIRFDVGGDAHVVSDPDGSLRAVAGPSVLAFAAPPAMWDSAQRPPATPAAVGRGLTDPPPAGSSSDDPSTPAGPADGARTAAVATQVTSDGDLLLRPAPALLSAGAATLPLFIDPDWDTAKSRWAYATNNNSTNTDTAIARVGADPDSGKLYRSFFEFPTTHLAGKQVHSAYVQMVVDHSWSCTNSLTHMYHAGGLSGTPRTKWATSLVSWVAVAASHANEGDGCSDSPQPDMISNFIDPKVTALMQTVADRSAPNITIGFCACNAKGEYETSKDRWKKFFPNKAKLIANINNKPGKPYGLHVAGIACGTGTISIGTLNPTLSAIFPDGDGTQSLRGSWEWLEQHSDGTWTDATPRKPAPPQTSAAANTRTTTAPLAGLAKDRSYAFRVRGTDSAPYNVTGPWSDWCRFTVDTTVPPVTVTVVTPPTGPGRLGTFRLSSPADDVTRFRYGWTEAYTSEVAAGVVAGVAGRSATVTMTVPGYGRNVLHAKAVDATLNEGYGSVDFVVERGSPAVAQWGMETYPGMTRAAAVADRQPSLAGDTPLTTAGVGWADDARMVGGQTATFGNGSSRAASLGAVIDSTQSFSFTAWVRVQDLTGYQAVVSKDAGPGQWGSARLQLRGESPPRWCMTMNTSSTEQDHIRACSPVPPVVGRWTHLAGSFDRATNLLRVWVDGVPTEVPFSTPLGGPGPVVVGQAANYGVAADQLRGNVADVQVFDRVLVGHDFTGQAATDPESGQVNRPGILDPITTGTWDFDATDWCADPADIRQCAAPDLGNWGRRLALTPGAGQGKGHRGVGLQLDDTYGSDHPTDPLSGTATREHGVTQRNMAGDGQPERWQDDPVLRTDESFTVAVWVRPDRLTGAMTAVSQAGTEQSSFELGVRNYTVNGLAQQRWSFRSVSRDDDTGVVYTDASEAGRSLTVEDTTVWTHLVGVWDTRTRQLRLYINGRPAGTASPPAMWHATGPLIVGAHRWSAAGGSPTLVDRWFGTVDNLFLYQGVMSDAQIALLHAEQSRPTS